MTQARSISAARRPPGVTVQWNDSLDAVLARMDAAAGDEVIVLQGDCPVGRILRASLERLHCHGNAAQCIAAVDAMDRMVAQGGGS
ncbi:MAG: hypothetical protein AB7I59_15605 [Geminicoccaceae bacterium]